MMSVSKRVGTNSSPYKKDVDEEAEEEKHIHARTHEHTHPDGAKSREKN